MLFAGHSLSSGPCPCPWGLQFPVPDVSSVLKPRRPQTRPFSSRGETLFLWGHRPDISCRPVALPRLRLLPRRQWEWTRLRAFIAGRVFSSPQALPLRPEAQSTRVSSGGSHSSPTAARPRFLNLDTPRCKRPACTSERKDPSEQRLLSEAPGCRPAPLGKQGRGIRAPTGFSVSLDLGVHGWAAPPPGSRHPGAEALLRSFPEESCHFIFSLNEEEGAIRRLHAVIIQSHNGPNRYRSGPRQPNSIGNENPVICQV